ncbi:MAG TPA: sulfite exporter TauE/SafE family protein [Bradyrhizobium sp.]|nr:sulfite exporter TauE/SafE family protein [Bradyrhizobium sp.]
MMVQELLAGIGTGLAGGFTSGLLGVSPGGGLVVFSVLLLGAEQHVAQGISLVAQIPPTSLTGIKRYRKQGSRSPMRWLVVLALGFIAGGIIGALAADLVSSSVLQWAYVAYLVLLDVMLILRRERKTEEQAPAPASPHLHWAALLAVGLFAGLSSGFLGIGGGLATVVGLSAILRVPQHQAQMVSLVLALVPTTIPSAWVYWKQGWSAPWPVLAGVIIGLLAGTDLGARLANRIDRAALRVTLIFFVSMMAIYMAYKALS